MKKILAIIFSFIVFTSVVAPVFAQEKLAGNPCLYKGVPTMDCVAPLFANAIYWLIVLSGTVAVFFIIFGGIKFLISSGEQARVEGAKKTITWAVIGLIVVLLSFAVVNIIADLTKVNCITRFGFTACEGPNSLKPNCGINNKPGYCATPGQVCVYEGGYICRYPCSAAHTGGYCPKGNYCARIEGSFWSCRLICNKTNKARGYCEGGETCTKNSADNWACK
jgi:hypothetical protein